MPRAPIDTTVLFAAAYRQDSAHADALPILRGVDDGSLPEAVVLDYVLVETLNGLATRAGHDAAVDLLDRIEENARFHIDSLNTDAFATGKALFRRHRPLSFLVDPPSFVVQDARRRRGYQRRHHRYDGYPDVQSSGSLRAV